MSLKFKSISIDDFFSIGHIDKDFKEGVYLVKGDNRDKPNDVSNGAGKTALFSAIYQGLYNKNSKDPKATITNTNNMYTGNPYKIDIEFEKSEVTYRVINDRNKNNIKILKDGVDISPKGIANQLVELKNIIGFDFQTFTSLTFLNQQSLASIIDLTNKDNIVYQFFDIEAINTLEKSLKKRKRDRGEDLVIANSKISVIKKQLSLANTFEVIDIEAILAQKDHQQSVLNSIMLQYSSDRVKVLGNSIKMYDSKLSQLYIDKALLEKEGKDVKELLEHLSKGTCPTCHQKYSGDLQGTEDSLKSLKKEYLDICIKEESLKNQRAIFEKKLSDIIDELDDKKGEVERVIRTLSVQALSAQDNNIAYAKIKGSIDELQGELDDIEEELPEVEDDLFLLDTLIAVLKSGAVVNEYLKKYKLLFIKNFRALKKYTAFDMDITIKVDKGKLIYTFFDGGIAKQFTSLSAGERTRVSLMLLLATLTTIEQLTNITINYLVLDELLGVLDTEGIDFLKSVLDSMRKEKSVYIITHHNEIEDSYADGVVTIIKESNISRLNK